MNIFRAYIEGTGVQNPRCLRRLHDKSSSHEVPCCGTHTIYIYIYIYRFPLGAGRMPQGQRSTVLPLVYAYCNTRYTPRFSAARAMKLASRLRMYSWRLKVIAMGVTTSISVNSSPCLHLGIKWSPSSGDCDQVQGKTICLQYCNAHCEWYKLLGGHTWVAHRWAAE